MLTALAQLDQGGATGVAGAIFWSVIIIALCVGAFFVYTQLKRWMKEPDEPSGGGGFTFSDLRRLHREGKLTDQEFETARAKMSAAAKKMTEDLPDPLAGRPPTPPAPPGG